jgi:hypothetical protein
MNETAVRSTDTVPDQRFDRPILIVSPPRSGSTLLFETMAKAPDLFTIGAESHMIIETLPGLHPRDRGWHSNRLTAADAQTESARQLAENLYRELRDRDGRRPAGPVRILEKTPKNSLRIPFFNALWPDGLFVYLYRDVRQTLASMMEGWASGYFRTYQRLPGWTGYQWSLLLVPGWRELIGKPLPEVVAHQWSMATNILLDDLERLPRERLRAVDHALFLAAPDTVVEPLVRSLGLGWDRRLGAELPLSKSTISRPRPDKWRRLEPAIKEIWPIVEAADARARAFLGGFEHRC